MKKMVTLFIALSFMLSLHVTAFAGEVTTGPDKNGTNIEVIAKVVHKVDGEYHSQVEDGTADIITNDGIEVKVSDAPDGAVKLIVVSVPKTETEAWNWITECLEGTATPIHTFDIYFEDQAGNRRDANDAVVTIHCPHCTSTPLVCSLDTDGGVYMLNTSVQTETVGVTFTTNGSTYYVMAEKQSAPELVDGKDPDKEEETKPNPEKSGDVKNPETGDYSNLLVWFSLMFVSSIGLAFGLFVKCKERYSL